jgi:hypothetical protein
MELIRRYAVHHDDPHRNLILLLTLRIIWHRPSGCAEAAKVHVACCVPVVVFFKTLEIRTKIFERHGLVGQDLRCEFSTI